MAGKKRHVNPGGPRIRFGASYAILPFVSINHYEYRIAGLYAWAGMTVDVWYLKDSVTVFGITKWVS